MSGRFTDRGYPSNGGAKRTRQIFKLLLKVIPVGSLMVSGPDTHHPPFPCRFSDLLSLAGYELACNHWLIGGFSAVSIGRGDRGLGRTSIDLCVE